VFTGAVPPFAVSDANLDCPPLFTEVEGVLCTGIAAPPAPTATEIGPPDVTVSD
jgi:hypothetical protein